MGDTEKQGYFYDIPRSTVALAGGLRGLFDTFASRARGFLRHDDSVAVRFDDEHLCIDAANVWLVLQDDGGPADGDAVRLRLEIVGGGAWTSDFQAFADLVGVWPEVTARRPIPRLVREGQELIAAARAIVIADQRCSTSYIQRKLQIGYNRAASIIEHLELEGVISAPDVGGRRQILVTE